jgi:type VI secretion system protein ImpH
MAAEGGYESATVSARLFREPHRFDFFQAVRLLEQLERQRADGRYPVGQDRPPAQEVVRFRALPALSFPAAAVSQLRQPDGPAGAGRPAEMLVTFMGLTGPSGVLPQHYTTLLLQRLRLKDTSLRDFLDLFNHRLISLFYRAWEKYRFPVAHERARRDPGGAPDLFTHCLSCLVGMGTAGLRGRLAVDDDALLLYGGFFAHFPRPAVCLERLLADHFQMPVAAEQFEGQWLCLTEDDSTRLAGPDCPQGRNTQLGLDAVAGDRIWDVQSKIRLRVGRLRYGQFRRLLPAGADWPAFVHLTRAYLGPGLDFQVQLVLAALEVPWCQLAADGEQGFRLGWDTWVRSYDFMDDIADVILTAESN